MLDIQYIRDNTEEVKRAITLKGGDCNIDTLLVLDAEKIHYKKNWMISEHKKMN